MKKIPKQVHTKATELMGIIFSEEKKNKIIFSEDKYIQCLLESCDEDIAFITRALNAHDSRSVGYPPAVVLKIKHILGDVRSILDYLFQEYWEENYPMCENEKEMLGSKKFNPAWRELSEAEKTFLKPYFHWNRGDNWIKHLNTLRNNTTHDLLKKDPHSKNHAIVLGSNTPEYSCEYMFCFKNKTGIPLSEKPRISVIPFLNECFRGSINIVKEFEKNKKAA